MRLCVELTVDSSVLGREIDVKLDVDFYPGEKATRDNPASPGDFDLVMVRVDATEVFLDQCVSAMVRDEIFGLVAGPLNDRVLELACEAATNAREQAMQDRADAKREEMLERRADARRGH